MYIDTTITVKKDCVVLFETDCECRIEYSINDGELDWDVIEFHFGRKPYTKVMPAEPLFGVLYDALNREWLQGQITEALIDNEDCYAREDV